MKPILSILFLSMFLSANAQVEIQGHRGARGLLPENSIPAFLKAIDLGVQTIEMDVVISKDGKVVVSHDHHLNPGICLDPAGQPIERGDKSFNLFKMDYAEIKKCDCGSLGNSGYPDQKKMSVYKPLLSEVIAEVDKHLAKSDRTVKYNIEVKAGSSGDNNTHPTPEKFITLVHEVIKDLPLDQIIIQSFDPRVLVALNSKYPRYTLAYLISNQKSWQKNVEELTFTPDIYSPHHRLISSTSVKELQEAGIKVIPWTVNSRNDIQKVIEMNVDGLITDYPGLAINILKSITNK